VIDLSISDQYRNALRTRWSGVRISPGAQLITVRAMLTGSIGVSDAIRTPDRQQDEFDNLAAGQVDRPVRATPSGQRGARRAAPSNPSGRTNYAKISADFRTYIYLATKRGFEPPTDKITGSMTPRSGGNRPSGRPRASREGRGVQRRIIRPGAHSIFNQISELTPPPLTRLAPQPGGCGRFAGLCLAHLVRCLDQARQFRPGIVRRDPTATMP
jgi:hypothetical protein